MRKRISNLDLRAATSRIEAWAFYEWILHVLRIYVWTEPGIFDLHLKSGLPLQSIVPPISDFRYVAIAQSGQQNSRNFNITQHSYSKKLLISETMNSLMLD